MNNKICPQCGASIPEDEQVCNVCNCLIDKELVNALDQCLFDQLNRVISVYKAMIERGAAGISPQLEVYSSSLKIISSNLFCIKNDGIEDELRELIKTSIYEQPDAAAAALVSECWLPSRDGQRAMFSQKREGLRVDLAAWGYYKSVSTEILRINGDLIFGEPEVKDLSKNVPDNLFSMVYKALNNREQAENDPFTDYLIRETIHFVEKFNEENPGVLDLPVQKVYSSILLNYAFTFIKDERLNKHVIGILSYLLRTDFWEDCGKKALYCLMGLVYFGGIGVPKNIEYALDFYEQCVAQPCKSDELRLFERTKEDTLRAWDINVNAFVKLAKATIENIHKQ